MIRLVFILLFISTYCFAQTKPYQDLNHESNTFGKTKTFRLYLPENYHLSTVRYPVIYFFHGWGGRHFKDDSAKLEYEKLQDLVNKYQFILVMWDGNLDESEPRPYNIGNHEDVKFRIQMKDYFPELISHIDSTYRTLTERDYRGIIGFSMGGFMSSFIAGKYPDKVSAIVNMVGSPEFFVGYPDNHTLYPVRYTFDNLKDVSVRLHNMDNCPLYYMNLEVKKAAEWEGLTQFDYWLGNGDHKVDDPDETKVFESAVQFICKRFKTPIKPNRSWSHYDLYSDFDLWGYSVTSDKSEPGFLYLRNVSPSGFGFYTHKWLPDGPSIGCKATVSTAPIYKKGGVYQIAFYKQNEEKPVLKQEKADKEGRLHIEFPEDGYEVSISDKAQTNDFVVLQYRLEHNSKFIQANKENKIDITLLKRGFSKYSDKKIYVTASCADSAISLSNTTQEIFPLKGEKISKVQAIGILCHKSPPQDASPPWVKLDIEILCDNEVFYDAITVPVFYDVPYFSHIRIDDGVSVRDKAIGSGNGNGLAEPSECLMLYENYQRLRLYTDDPYVENNSEILYDEMISSGIWPDGYTLSSVIKIADNCPSGHTIEFLAHYETKTFMPIHRKVVWGKVRIVVK
ncbi:hypothetical protein M2459_002801 [Parabacteroides sp. PF5-5]|uniref:alpha/beta hydrolase n=1 Tax=unclassified Parabacteroides TaxID=2649774 RepID=UPI0024733384|nr:MULTISPECIES: alpha/beta fold hydrolase [unclassified Parabacteroides]MDH6306055.1 hypothetical protein [Parabacteroides sp. PH5-39]MDH6317047.1 hypothetical protein [Parabacteroides sp. PF5-13]MDH6320800.1 hypothetical protein [Parabacteroides sp. PH5-13]MDH6324498.1 hypothetical protein [Parabacteroides sp. PH5-8]MDH6328232.1 hypothetical protein [Parabacteroides sp. PH5-41]